jgi:Txe/YoeB family toxin of Txe-Axe toxin-antitoxin module
MDVIYFNGFWTIQDTKTYSHYLFIFGDNDLKQGKKGQSIIRDQPNTIGIPTKKKPSSYPSSYYYDTEYEENIKKIDKAFEEILSRLKNEDFKGIILPENGIGTGLAKLQINAKNTLKYIENKIQELIKIIST